MKSLLLIDGYNMFIRSFVANPTMDVNGERVGGVLGMLQSLGKLITEHRPYQVVVIWDGSDSGQRRRSVYSEYKAGRRVRLNSEYEFGDAKSDMENMQRQRNLAFEFLEIVGIPQVRVEATEADDLIAFAAKYIDSQKTIIVTTDTDMLQLVDSKCSIYSPIKKILYTKENFVSKIGTLPENYSLMKSLIGDKSDNIPGVRGFGTKTVLKMFPFLAEKISSVEEILEKVKEQKGTTAKRLIDDTDVLKKNMGLIDLSDPAGNVSAAAALKVRDAANEFIKPCKEFDLRVRLMKEGISVNERLTQPFKELAIMRHPKCSNCGKKMSSKCPTKCDENH